MRTKLLLSVALLTLLLAAPALTPATLALGQWTRVSPLQGATSIVVAPNAPATLFATRGPDVLRSQDGGQTWTRLPRPAGAQVLRSLAVDPRDWRSVYVANSSNNGQSADPVLYHSGDGGQTWQIVFNRRVAAVAVSSEPAHRVTISAEGDGQPGAFRVLQSDDVGGHWREVWNTLADQSMATPTVGSLVPFGPSVVALVYGYHGGSLYRLGDRVEDWRSIPSITPQVRTMWSQPRDVRVGPANTLYLLWGTQAPQLAIASLRKTTDGGRTWYSITPPIGGKTGEQSGGVEDGPDLTALTTDPTQPTALFAAVWTRVGDRGSLRPYVMRSRDGGATWSEVGDPLHDLGPQKRIGSLAYSPTRQTLFAVTEDGGWQYVFTPDDQPPQIAAWFRRYYDSYDGWRLMGAPLRHPILHDSYPSQLFEKGRAEDHSIEERDPNWRIMYGLLVDEMIRGGMPVPVGGDTSTLTYVGLARAAAEDRRVPAPAGFTRGVWTLPNGSVFIPYDAHLNAAPGHTVPPVFWNYLNRADLFPGGWLHDIGLPMTEPLTATVDKGDIKGRVITVQAFQRTILTYDPLNPPAWRVERANVGRDFLEAFPED